MTTTLTIILVIVQIIVFIFFGWLGVLQLRDYYHDKKEFNKKKDASDRQLYLKAEEAIMEQIHNAYNSGVRHGWRQTFDKDIVNPWDDKRPEYERGLHEIIKIITKTEE